MNILYTYSTYMYSRDTKYYIGTVFVLIIECNTIPTLNMGAGHVPNNMVYFWFLVIY